jgi:hypothetical protein
MSAAPAYPKQTAASGHAASVMEMVIECTGDSFHYLRHGTFKAANTTAEQIVNSSKTTAKTRRTETK